MALLSQLRPFLLGEVRYLSVKKAYPNEAEELFAEAQKMAQLRYKTYVRKQAEDWSNEQEIAIGGTAANPSIIKGASECRVLPFIYNTI